jgi:hypothetical protein
MSAWIVIAESLESTHLLDGSDIARMAAFWALEVSSKIHLFAEVGLAVISWAGGLR